MRTESRTVEIPQSIFILTDQKPSVVEQYALEQMQRDLKQWFHIDAKHVTDPALIPGSDAATFVIGHVDAPHVQTCSKKVSAGLQEEDLKPEGYCLATRGPAAVVAGSDDNGALYGAFALLQLLREVNGKLLLPQVIVTDFPSIRDRGIYNFGSYWPGKVTHSRLDTYARLRINVIPCSMRKYGFQYKKGVLDEKGFKLAQRLGADCHKRGMKAMGVFYFIGLCRALDTYLCPGNPEHVKLIQEAVKRYYEAGFDGFTVNFDDITKDHIDAFMNCEACKKTGYSMGKMHAEWIRIIKQVGDQFGGKKILTVPAPYSGYYNWKKPYGADPSVDQVQFLKDFYGVLDDPFFADVDMWHCAFGAEEIEALKKLGLRNYIWWFNSYGQFLWDIGRSNYKSFFKQNQIFSGFVNPLIGWPSNYGNCSYDEATSTFNNNEKTMHELKTLPERTHGAYLCGCGMYETHIGFGAYAWDPAGFDWPGIERAWVARTFGPESVPVYVSWKKQIRSLCRDFNTLRQFSPQKEERMAEYRARYDELEEALQRLLDQHREFVKDPGFALIDACFTERLIEQMKKNDQALSGFFTKRVVRASVSRMVAQPRTGNVRKYRHLSLGSNVTDYRLIWHVIETPDNRIYAYWKGTAGIGMQRPSVANWQSSGFFNLEVNGMSLGSIIPEFKVVDIDQYQRAIRARWSLDYADVEIVFSLLEDDALMMDGKVIPHQGEGPHKLQIELVCNPSANVVGTFKTGGAKRWIYPDKYFPHFQVGTGIDYIDLTKPCWYVLYDKINDYPFVNEDQPKPNASQGPAAFMLEPENVDWTYVHMTDFLIKIFVRYNHGTERFRLAFYDLNKTTNADALKYFDENGDRLFQAFRYDD